MHAVEIETLLPEALEPFGRVVAPHAATTPTDAPDTRARNRGIHRVAAQHAGKDAPVVGDTIILPHTTDKGEINRPCHASHYIEQGAEGNCATP